MDSLGSAEPGAASPCWILTTPRSGSNLLTTCLNAAGRFRPPIREWFNNDGPTWRGESLPRNCKIFPSQFREAFGDLTFERVNKRVRGVRWICLSRRDKFAQAVSLFFAMRTGIWTAHDQRTVALHSSIAVEPDDRELERQLRWVREWDSMVRVFASRNNCLTLDYEDLVLDLEFATSTALTYLNVGCSHVPTRLPLRLAHPNKERIVKTLRERVTRTRLT